MVMKNPKKLWQVYEHKNGFERVIGYLDHEPTQDKLTLRTIANAAFGRVVGVSNEPNKRFKAKKTGHCAYFKNHYISYRLHRVEA